MEVMAHMIDLFEVFFFLFNSELFNYQSAVCQRNMGIRDEPTIRQLETKEGQYSLFVPLCSIVSFEF